MDSGAMAECGSKLNAELLLYAEPTSNAVNLHWIVEAIAATKTTTKTLEFEVETRLARSLEWTAVYYGCAKSYVLSGLPAGVEVDVRVRVVGVTGKDEEVCQDQISTRTLSGPPGNPLALAAWSVSSREMELRWRPPIHNGGYAITGYYVKAHRLHQSELLIENCRTVELYGNNDRCVVDELDPGAEYKVLVQAFNELGSGPCSGEVVVKTPPAPPAAPVPPAVLTTTSDSISLGWVFPEGNGAKVESFELQMTVVGYGNVCQSEECALRQGACDHKSVVVFEPHIEGSGLEFQRIYRGQSNEFKVTNLQPFTRYAFRVQALNVAGASGYHGHAICCSSSAPPSAPPTPTIVSRTSSSLTLKWEAPTQDNGASVERYVLEMRREGTAQLPTDSKCVTRRGKKRRPRETRGNSDKAAEHKFTDATWEAVYNGQSQCSPVGDLAPGQEYQFRVTAHNALGKGPPSKVSKAKTLAAEAPPTPTFSTPTATPTPTPHESEVSSAKERSQKKPAAAKAKEKEIRELIRQGRRPPVQGRVMWKCAPVLGVFLLVLISKYANF